MKKIILFAMTCFIILSAHSAFAADKTVLSEEAVQAYDMLCAFGIIDEKNDVIPSEITRAEAMDFIIRLGNIVLDTDDTVSYFNDVGSDNEYLCHINTAYKYNIIKGNGSGFFSPDEYMTIQNFSICLLRLAGYGEYLDIINPQKLNSLQKDILNSVSAEHSSTLTSSDMLIMMANTLEYDYMGISGVSRDGEFIYTNYNDNKTVLSEFFGINTYTGQIVSTPDVSVGNRSLTVDNNVKIKTDNGEINFKSDDRGFKDSVGLTVDFYVRDDEKEVIYYKNTDNADDYTFAGECIEDVASNLSYMDYYEAEKNKKKRAKFDVSTKFVYNGRVCYELTKQDISENVDSVRIVDYDNDGIFDIVYVWKYDIAYVSAVSPSSYTVTDSITMKQIFLDENSIQYDVEIFADGKKSDFSKLAIGQVLTIAVSKDGDIPKKKTVYISTKVVSGTVNVINHQNHILTIDKKEYKTTSGFNVDSIKLGSNYDFAVNHLGNIAGIIEHTEYTLKYAYMLDIIETESLNEKIKIKLYTSDEGLKIFDFSDKFKHNDAKGDWSALKAALFNSSEKVIQQLISYKLNSDGQITYFYSADGVSGIPLSDENKTLTLNAHLKASDIILSSIYKSYISGKYIADSKTKVFYVNVDDDGNTHEKGIKIVDPETYFQTKVDADIMVYDSNYLRIPGAVVVFNGGNVDLEYPRMRNTPIVVERLSKIINSEGDEVLAVYAYTRTSKGWEKSAFEIAEGVDTSWLKPGVCITYILNSKEQIEEYYIKYANEKPDGYNDTTGLFGDETYTEQKPALSSLEKDDLTFASAAVCGTLEASVASPKNIILLNVGGMHETVIYAANNCPSLLYHADTDTVVEADWLDITQGTKVYVFTKWGEAIMMIGYTE